MGDRSAPSPQDESQNSRHLAGHKQPFRFCKSLIPILPDGSVTQRLQAASAGLTFPELIYSASYYRISPLSNGQREAKVAATNGTNVSPKTRRRHKNGQRDQSSSVWAQIPPHRRRWDIKFDLLLLFLCRNDHRCNKHERRETKPRLRLSAALQ